MEHLFIVKLCVPNDVTFVRKAREKQPCFITIVNVAQGTQCPYNRPHLFHPFSVFFTPYFFMASSLLNPAALKKCREF